MTITNGSKVSIHYTLTVDGQKVDSSEGREPLEYTHGQGQIIPGLEAEIAGLKKGDKKTVEIPPEKAYGHVDPEAIQKVPKDKFAEPDKLQVGGVITGHAGDQEFQAIVAGIDEENVTIDMNHPLAGKTLHFEIEIANVE